MKSGAFHIGFDSGHLLRMFVDSVREYAFILLDVDGTVRSWNTGAQRIKGWEADEILGRHFASFYPPADVAIGKPETALRTAAAGGRYEDDGVRIRKDGSQFHANVVITAIRDADGRLQGFGKITRDISDRVRMEAQLRRHEAQLSNLVDTVFDTVVDAMITIDESGAIRSFNKACVRLFGYTPEEALGHNVSMLMPEPYASEHDGYLAAYRKTGIKKIIGQGRIAVGRRKDGSTFPMELAVGQTAQGEDHAFVGIIRNLTERHEAEALRDQLRQAQKMEAVGQLTGGIAHDFNNILGVIIGNLDLLRDLCHDRQDIAEFAGDALDAALHGGDLTQRLLAFGRRQKLQPEVMRLNDLVADIIKLLTRSLGENIVVELSLAEDAWMVDVDRAQLESVIANLATNARDAMPNGGRLIVATRNSCLDTVYAALHPEVVAGEYAVIEVSDTGTGIPPDVLARIFEPFYTTKEEGRGSGLGLSMVFGFMKQSGGHINVYSEVGVGTTFRLYLPRAAAGGRTIAAPVEQGAGAAQGNGLECILVVEDNPRLQRVVVRQLAEANYRVIAVDNAHAAMQIVQGSDPIDLLLSDIVMPGEMDGHALARAAAARRPALKILLTSGFPQRRFANVEDAKLSYPLLSKPYRKDELIRVVRNVLDDQPVAG